MIKKLVICFGLCLIMLFAVSFAKAMIIISQPSDVYNFGDSIKVELKIEYYQNINAFLKVILVCDGNETLIYFSPVQLEKGKEKNIEVEWPVFEVGSCYIYAALENQNKNKIEEVKTTNIELTDKINIEASLNKNIFKPSEELKLIGKAVKANGDVFDKTIIITVNQKEHIVETSKGNFSFSMQLSSDIAPGLYDITASAKDSYGNKGSATFNFEVETIPTSLVVETNNESFMPAELLFITPKLLDQANNVLAKDVLVKLSIPKESFFGEEKILLEELVVSGNSTKYFFPKNAKPGNYNIKASFENFKDEKSIKVLALERINFSVENNTLYVENTGNVPYKKHLEINFKIENQTTTKIIELDLDVGENKTFELNAPKGTYEIEITSDNESAVFDSVSLTGDVVTVIELKPSRTVQKNFWIYAILGAIVVLALMLFFVKKKRKYKNKNPIKTKKTPKIESKNDSTLKTIFSRHSSKLAANFLIPTLVYGTKQEITTLAIKLESKEKEHADQFFASAVEKIKAYQGVADIDDSTLIVMFNIIKQQRHDMAAIKAAEEIRDIATKMSFKIKAGINTGMATVSSVTNKSVSYSQINSSVSLAKELAAKAQLYEILIGEETYRKVGNAIKTRKTTPYYINENSAIEVYTLSDTSPDSEKDYQWFINRALGK